MVPVLHLSICVPTAVNNSEFADTSRNRAAPVQLRRNKQAVCVMLTKEWAAFSLSLSLSL